MDNRVEEGEEVTGDSFCAKGTLRGPEVLRKELKALTAIPDGRIDISEIPELTEGQLSQAVRGQLPALSKQAGHAGCNSIKSMNIIKGNKKKLPPENCEKLLGALKARFEKNPNRHRGLDWATIQAKLEADADKLWSLNEMERTGGEPDVVGHDKKTDEYIFYDCSAESPQGRRSICYDREALASRKEHKPKDSAVGMATVMGIELLTEEQYRELQKLGTFDVKTSSWVKTPSAIRELGGALFCDRRYETVFVYHNGAESYYGGRGFRGSLRV